MNLSKDEKLKLVSEILRVYVDHFKVVTMQEHAREVLTAAGFPKASSIKK
jgi:hypothetical protein